MRNKGLAQIVFVFFLILLVVLIVATHQDYGLTWDENWYAHQGTYYLVSLYNAIGIPHNMTVEDLSVHNPLFHLALTTRGVVYDIAVMWIVSLFGAFNISTIHLVRGLLSLFIFLFTGLSAARLYGRWYGVMAMVFLLLYPSFYGHIFNNAPDIPGVLFTSLTVWYFIRFLQSKKSLKHQMILGFIFALAATQRLVLAYLTPVAILVLLVHQLRAKAPFKTIVKMIAGILTFMVICMHLLHPYLFQHPIFGMQKMLYDSLHFSGYPHPILFEGVFHWGTTLPWYYLPKTIAITTPLVILVLFSAGVFFIVASLFRSRTQSSQKYEHLFLLMIVTVPIGLVLWKRPVIYDSWRHFLFLTVPIVLIAIRGLKNMVEIQIFRREARYQTLNKVLRTIIIAFIVFGLTSTAKDMVALHPYQYVYYNSLVGGLPGANGNYETDYWGLGYMEAVEWFNKNINDNKTEYVLLTEGNAQSSTHYFSSNMRYTTDMSEADYFISFARWHRHLRNLGPVVHTVERMGVPLIFIRKVEDGNDAFFPR